MRTMRLTDYNVSDLSDLSDLLGVAPMTDEVAPAIRDRIKDFRRVDANDIEEHPLNYRRHPQQQIDAMTAALNEIGFADVLVTYETEEGRLRLIDGHLRRDLSTDTDIPVIVLDVDENEAAKLLATLDPLTSLARIDYEALERLTETVVFSDAELAKAMEVFQGISAKTRPVEFEAVNDDTLACDYKCPKCSYEWAGRPR